MDASTDNVDIDWSMANFKAIMYSDSAGARKEIAIVFVSCLPCISIIKEVEAYFAPVT